MCIVIYGVCDLCVLYVCVICREGGEGCPIKGNGALYVCNIWSVNGEKVVVRGRLIKVPGKVDEVLLTNVNVCQSHLPQYRHVVQLGKDVRSAYCWPARIKCRKNVADRKRAGCLATEHLYTPNQTLLYSSTRKLICILKTMLRWIFID